MEFVPDYQGEYKSKVEIFASQVGKEWPTALELPTGPEWSYHVFLEHGLEATAEAVRLVDYARQNGAEISDEQLVGLILSMLEHDLGNHWGPPIFHDYPEHRSEEVGTGFALLLKIPRTIIGYKREATHATRPGAKITTIVEKIARRADIANFAWEYNKFKNKTIKVWREEQMKCMAQGKDYVIFSQWVINIKDFVIGSLLDQDLTLGPFDFNEASQQCVFLDDVAKNFQQIGEEINSPDFVEPELYPLVA